MRPHHLLYPVAALLLSCGLARAEVVEDLDYEYYDVDASEGWLGDAINAATPIRQNGKRFHGYTKWQVNWRYWWDQDSEGCTINRTEVKATGKITLPQLVDSTDENQEYFDEYIENLEAHELGHYEFAQTAAAEIDEFLLDLDTMDTCDEVQREANAGAREILDGYIRDEKQYDVDTGHGRTQGAYLQR